MTLTLMTGFSIVTAAYTQLETPSEVAIAVRMLIAI